MDANKLLLLLLQLLPSISGAIAQLRGQSKLTDAELLDAAAANDAATRTKIDAFLKTL